jgi:hypothetical protein
MATLKQYFDTDMNRLPRYNQSITFRVGNEDVEVVCQINYDFDAGVYFVSYYVPVCKNFFQLHMGLVHDLRWVEKMIKEIIVTSGAVYYKDTITSTELKFSGRIFIYCEVDLSAEQMEEIKSVSNKLDRAVQFRSQSYAIKPSVTIMMRHSYPIV